MSVGRESTAPTGVGGEGLCGAGVGEAGGEPRHPAGREGLGAASGALVSPGGVRGREGPGVCTRWAPEGVSGAAGGEEAGACAVRSPDAR